MSRVAVPLFVGAGDRVRVYTSMGSASLAGIGNLFVPLLIASLIVLNTMLGAVYERSGEIGVYSSVGLAPSHIASLFMAEALVFAIVGAVLGYLVGQTTTLLLAHYATFGWDVSQLLVAVGDLLDLDRDGGGGALDPVSSAQGRGHGRARRDPALGVSSARRRRLAL